MISIHEIKNLLENNNAIKNPAFITKIIDKIMKDHEYWKEELNCLACSYRCNDDHVSVIVSSRYNTYHFINGVKNPEYINMLSIGNNTLQSMYDVCRYRAIQSNVK